MFTWIINNSIWPLHSVCRLNFSTGLAHASSADRRRKRGATNGNSRFDIYDWKLQHDVSRLFFSRSFGTMHAYIGPGCQCRFFCSFHWSDNVNWILSYLETVCCLQHTTNSSESHDMHIIWSGGACMLVEQYFFLKYQNVFWLDAARLLWLYDSTHIFHSTISRVKQISGWSKSENYRQLCRKTVAIEWRCQCVQRKGMKGTRMSK